MQLLKWMGYTGLSMRNLEPYLCGERQGKVVGITFDDGYQNNLQYALPTLKKMGFNPKIRSKGRAVQLEKMSEICDYLKRIGTSNPKHLERLARSKIFRR